MARTVIRGGTVLDQRGERRADVAIDDGRITEVAEDLAPSDGDVVLDATGWVVSPGFVDLHVHLREPGKEEAETIETGSRAAALGGFTAVVAMPNTDPAQDSVAVVDFVRTQGEKAGLCEVLPSGCITVAREGALLAPYGELADAGVRLFTDDGNGVQDPLLMRRALEYAKPLGVVLAQHCEVASLTKGAVMHEGACCSRLGLPGWPSLAEELMLFRDIELVRLTGAPMHFLHLSTARSVQLVRQAKAEGLPVTAEAAPHHFALTDELLTGYDPLFKVNPPLRTAADIEAIKAGLADGTIDAIATDHAPHALHEKELDFREAPPGMIGFETAVAVVLELVRAGEIAPLELVRRLSTNPARILRVQGGTLAEGAVADVAIVDPARSWKYDPAKGYSKSVNSPWAGHTLVGRVTHTIVAGQVVYDVERGILT